MEKNDIVINDVVTKHDIHGNSNARQTFQNIKRVTHIRDLTLPYKVSAPAPENINVYTDGSWLHAAKHFIGIGGAGVWWPGRALCKTDGLKHMPASDAEKR